MSQQYDYFTSRELKCRCCGEEHMDDLFMRKLVVLREAMGFPFPVTSAFRCPKHNHEVSSSGFTGAHTTGKAVDIQISGGNASRLLRGAFVFGFNGIGAVQHGQHEKRYIHIDMLDRSHQTFWTY